MYLAQETEKTAHPKLPSWFLVSKSEYLLIDHEGVERRIYPDSKGIMTIGVGRNLEANGLSSAEIVTLFRNDYREAEQIAEALTTGFEKLNAPRRAVVINMAFNLGGTRYQTFVKMLKAIERENYHEAAAEMLDSKWAKKDVPKRAAALALMMESGEW
jgi:lysozyme